MKSRLKSQHLQLVLKFAPKSSLHQLKINSQKCNITARNNQRTNYNKTITIKAKEHPHIEYTAPELILESKKWAWQQPDHKTVSSTVEHLLFARSVTTDFTGGGSSNTSFLLSTFLNVTVKRIMKIGALCQSCHKKTISGLLFMRHGVTHYFLSDLKLSSIPWGIIALWLASESVRFNVPINRL